jgi:asparagine synthase (glutamine-hydrolysing)
MCGIAGIIDLGNKPVQPNVLLSMSKSIAHRGPDDEGYILMAQTNSNFNCYAGYDSVSEIKERFPILEENAVCDKMNIGLAHRRFSIIDLSRRGHQPFLDIDGKCCVVFNGEIYNYIELRQELERIGHKFFSTSDTEVLAEAYKAWGTGCFSRLNGFWAIAIYDREKHCLIISRDRLGKKPLYWTKRGDRVYFASEIKALLQVPEIKGSWNKVNEEAVYYWLEYGFRDYSSSTFFDGIFCLQPACWAIVDKDFPNNVNTFWTASEKRMTEKQLGVEDACTSIRETLEDAVKIRLRADVPWSIELSGGLDSSSLVAIASQIGREKTHVVTVRFPEKEWNEEPFAHFIADRFNVDYHVIDPPVANIWQQMAEFTFLHEEPYHSPNNRVSQLYWSIMRTGGTKISLQGTGGDELFAGYYYYFPLALYEAVKTGKIRHLMGNLFHWTEYREGFWSNIDLISYLLRTLAPWIRVKHRLRNYIKIKPPENSGAPFKSLHEALSSDMTKTKMHYWLLSYDKNSMGIPIEVRSPLLDYRIVELASLLPLTYLIKDGWHKWIFRKAMEDILPGEVVWRKNKMGFPFPYERFIVDSKRVIKTIFDHADNPFLDFSRQEFFNTNWYFISFILWYEMFINRNKKLFNELELLNNRADHSTDNMFRPEYLGNCS